LSETGATGEPLRLLIFVSSCGGFFVGAWLAVMLTFEVLERHAERRTVRRHPLKELFFTANFREIHRVDAL
jgi:hypothetical protein